MRKILLFYLLLFSLFANADNVKNHKMILNFKDGNNVTFVLKDKPQITFDGNLFIVNSTTGMIEYLRSDIEDFYFDVIGTDVEYIEYCGEDNVVIYDMKGRQIINLHNDSLNSAKLYLNDYESGIYIIKIGNKSIKYLKK